MLYGAVFVVVVPWMVYWPMRLSSSRSDPTIQETLHCAAHAHVTASHPNYPAYSHRLSDGWLFGWNVGSFVASMIKSKGLFLAPTRKTLGY